MSPAELFERVVQVAPAFGQSVAEHLQDNDGLLPRVLMPRLLGFIGERLSADVPVAAPVLGVLELLEVEVVGGDAEAENVIAVSFVEHLEVEPYFDRVYPLLGPNLRAVHASFVGERPSQQNAG
jgi:hypothetical protein